MSKDKDKSDERVRLFKESEAPFDPVGGVQRPGWYWKSRTGRWRGPAKGGEAEARQRAEVESRGRRP